jgi:hypothetical protein
MGRLVVPTAAHHSACMYCTDSYSSATRASTSYLGFETLARWEGSGSMRYLCNAGLCCATLYDGILGSLFLSVTTGRVEDVPGLERKKKKITRLVASECIRTLLAFLAVSMLVTWLYAGSSLAPGSAPTVTPGQGPGFDATSSRTSACML